MGYPKQSYFGDRIESRNFIATYNSFCFLFRAIHKFIVSIVVLSTMQCHTQRRTSYTQCLQKYFWYWLNRGVQYFGCTLTDMQSVSQSFTHSVKLHITYFKCLINLTKRNALIQQQKNQFVVSFWFYTRRANIVCKHIHWWMHQWTATRKARALIM